MEWNKLVNKTRVPSYEKDNNESLDQAFDSDYRRIVKSSAFRRLQDKTQVYPLDRSDFVRTRLTHSLEVAMMSRDLLNTIVEYANNEGIDTTYLSQSARLLECASLIHDIGNPPFGHFGEEAIRLWFKRNEEFIPQFEYMDEQMKMDFLNFEGNAQTIRVLTKLHDYNGASTNGMRLTASVLDSVIKYTAKSNEIDKNYLQKKKMGYYYSENLVFNEIKSLCGTVEMRHPLVFILEAADDISYTFSDLEDGYKFGMYHYSDLRDCVNETVGKEVLPLKSDDEEKEVQEFLRKYQARTYFETSKEYVRQYDDIMEGKLNRDLFDDESNIVFKLFNELKYFCFKYIFDDQRIIDQELIGYHIIEQLLDVFVPVVLKYDAGSDPEKPYSEMDLLDKKIFRTYFSGATSLYKMETKNATEEEKNYYRLKMAVDYICGMTDNYARKIYKSMFEV